MRPVRSFALPLVTFTLAAAAMHVAAQTPTIEERAEAVRRTLGTPPPVETVIDRGRVIVQPPAAAAPAAAAPAPQSVTVTPDLSAQPIPGILQTPPEFLERLNALFGSQFTFDGGPGAGDLRGGIGVAVPQSLSPGRVPSYVPSFGTHSSRGVPVRGASNVTTAPRGFEVGQSNP